jgi:glucosyl-3-phosphoglycerate synthase
VSTEEVLPAFDDLGGKGDAMWRSVFAADGDLIVWCDADIRNFGARFVIGLVGPLLTRSDVDFVKGYYDRPLDGRHGEGGRVTELVARPLVSLLFPHLSTIIQPLAGEYAGRREILEQLPFSAGYGVDLAMLIDISARFGLESIAQVDLGTRIHRNRSLDELSPQSMAIMQTVLARAGLTLLHGPARPLVRPGSEPVLVETIDRPPLIELAAYRRRSACPQGYASPVGQVEPRKPQHPEKPSFPVGIVVVGVLAVLGALWLLRFVTGVLFSGVKLALIGIVVYAAVRLAMGSRDRR